MFIDADVLFAATATTNAKSASLALLKIAEATLIDAVVSTQVVTEAERNLADFAPIRLPELQLLIARSLQIVPDPTEDEIATLAGCAHPKDLPILAAAVREQCRWLATFNTKHYQPGHQSLRVAEPGNLIRNARWKIAGLED